MLFYNDPGTPGEALVWLADCALGTVSYMAGLKKRSKAQFDRHKKIAQVACDCIERFKINAQGTRAEDIIGKTTVEEWAKQFYPEELRPVMINGERFKGVYGDSLTWNQYKPSVLSGDLIVLKEGLISVGIDVKKIFTED